MSARTSILPVLTLFFTAYVGGYFALLKPAELVILDGASGTRVRLPTYRVGGSVTAAVFKPALCLDQRVRPSYWAWEALPYGSNCTSIPDEVTEQ